MKVLIKNFPNYYITNCGQVISVKTGRTRKRRDNGNGYSQIDLYNGSKGVNKYIHKLVAEHFLGASEKDEINHKDGNKENCDYKNLEICSHKENIAHAEREGLIIRDSLGKFLKTDA